MWSPRLPSSLTLAFWKLCPWATYLHPVHARSQTLKAAAHSDALHTSTYASWMLFQPQRPRAFLSLIHI
eukprot:13674110-Alexandrium_andersonii.AAC.1